MLFLVTLAAWACARGETKPLSFGVSKVTTSAAAQPFVESISLGPNFEIIPQVRPSTPVAGKVFVLLELEVTNRSVAKLTFEGVNLKAHTSGLSGDEVPLYYLMPAGDTERAYISIGKDVGAQPKDDIEQGKALTWQLLAIVDEGKKEMSVQYPGADPALVRF
ncbi:MAG: hypothetical protein ACXW5U_12475 [Thermoanaerobaculia bacterium]